MLSSIPLMALALIVYNGLMFGLGGGPQWDVTMFSLPMVSGAEWKMDLSDIVLSFGLFLLFIEILKSTRVGQSSIVDHMLSTLVFIVFLIEFLLIPGAATSTFFILMLMALIDVLAGFSVSIRSATRDVSFGSSGL